MVMVMVVDGCCWFDFLLFSCRLGYLGYCLSCLCLIIWVASGEVDFEEVL